MYLHYFLFPAGLFDVRVPGKWYLLRCDAERWEHAYKRTTRKYKMLAVEVWLNVKVGDIGTLISQNNKVSWNSAFNIIQAKNNTVTSADVKEIIESVLEHEFE